MGVSVLLRQVTIFEQVYICSTVQLGLKVELHYWCNSWYCTTCTRCKWVQLRSCTDLHAVQNETYLLCTSQLVDLTWVYAPPRMCQYPAGVVNPQRHTYQGRTGRGSSGTRAAQVAPLLPGKHPHLRAPLCKVQVEFHCGMQAGNIWLRTPPR